MKQIIVGIIGFIIAVSCAFATYYLAGNDFIRGEKLGFTFAMSLILGGLCGYAFYRIAVDMK